MKKRWIGTALCAAMVVASLSGCGLKEPEAPATTAAPAASEAPAAGEGETEADAAADAGSEAAGDAAAANCSDAAAASSTQGRAPLSCCFFMDRPTFPGRGVSSACPMGVSV